MDSFLAVTIVAALGSGAVTGLLIVPAELARVRRMTSLGGHAAGLPHSERRSRGLLSGLLAKLSGYLAERDEGLIAGLGLSGAATALYRQWRPILPLIAGLVATTLRWGRSDSLTWLAAGVIAAVMLPEVLLRWLIGRRRSRIIREFPELVDLLAVAAAGGLSLPGALRAATTDDTGPLGQEVRIAVRETAAGTPLHAALRLLAKRVGVPAVSAFVGSLCEAESLGVPLADSLTIQSESARTAYRQQVEGRLSQLPLKMTICALVFLFPTAFIVVALPNIIAFTRGLW